MKYLKFNESRKSRNRLQEYCNEHLTELIDKGISIEVDVYPPYNNAPYHWVNIVRREGSKVFRWGDISDQMIPFLTVLKDDFILHTMSDSKNLNIIPNINSFMSITYKEPSRSNMKREYYTYEQVINNEVDNREIYYLNFTTWKDSRKRV